MKEKGEGRERGRGREGEGKGQGVAGPPFANFWIRPCDRQSPIDRQTDISALAIPALA